MVETPLGRWRRLRNGTWRVSTVACLAAIACTMAPKADRVADAALAPTALAIGAGIPGSSFGVLGIPRMRSPDEPARNLALLALLPSRYAPFGRIPAGLPMAERPLAFSEAKESVDGGFLKMREELLALASPKPAPDPNEMLRFGSMQVRRAVAEDVVRAARSVGIDPVLLMAVADKESTFAASAKASTSSATGLFQFIESTWLKAVRDFGASHGLAKEASLVHPDEDGDEVVDAPADEKRILDLRRDPYLSAVLASEMLKRDGTAIAEEVGRGLTPGEQYLIHFLGPDDASKFLSNLTSHPNGVAARLLPKPARANRSIFSARERRRTRGLSFLAVRDKFDEMIGVRIDRYRDADRLAADVAH